MGYDLHIVRGPRYLDEAAHQFAAEEWLQYIESDDELSLAGYNGPHFALWSGQSSYPDPWIDWSSGAIYSKSPDAAIIAKLIQIAKRLGGQVRGDDGEVYTSPTDFHYDS
jgi:hypothetical protein